MNGYLPTVAVLRFLTRERFGFHVEGFDRGPSFSSPPRATRWFRRVGRVAIVVAVQHQTWGEGGPWWTFSLRDARPWRPMERMPASIKITWPS